MVFSSILFLFLFLPVTLLLYLIVGPRFRNSLLLLMSLLFYAWGEKGYLLLMVCSIAANYFFGRFIAAASTEKKKYLVAAAVALNLAPLVFFKYSSFFSVVAEDVLSLVGISSNLAFSPLHLPIGISFFTFQAISYIIDVARRVSPPQKNILDIGLYITFFPQLIAGPIVRYHDIAAQIASRRTRLEDFSCGVERFIIGLAKKVLIANQMAVIGDLVFGFGPGELGMATAWLGVICYTLQIYFDFSGYSDMAIGLARMFGFRLLENFNYPYISRSVQEFWRRWHISLSNWFRDYLYIPLGGNRGSSGRTCFNLLLVFFLCGFWHGASWNFIIWGLFHGFFLVLERSRFGIILKQLPAVVRHLYVLLVVVNGWVFFRAESIDQAGNFFTAMYGLGEGAGVNPFLAIGMDPLFMISLVLALLLSTPLWGWICVRAGKMTTTMEERPSGFGSQVTRTVWLSTLLLLTATTLAVDAYNPFIYFRF
ncbi:MAG: MBOAT family O-acyltransferase [Thermodesulfobacteriota bacterium]